MSDFNNNNFNQNGFDREVVDVKLKQFQKNVKRIVPIAVVLILLALAIFNSAYMLENKENGVVLRFGTVTNTVKEPGLHFKVPFIDTVQKVPVGKIWSMEYGYRTSRTGDTQGAAVYDDVESERTVIVDGANNNASIALIELIIQYQIEDPVDYLFKVDDVEGTLLLALEDTVRASMQAVTLDEAKTSKDMIDKSILPALQKKMNDYEAGIKILSVNTQNVLFLPNVETAYQEKENANQYKNGKSEDAEKYFNTIIPEARAEAKKIVEEANAYKATTVANAKAGVAQFDALYAEYLNNPEILMERYYIDAMSEFFRNNTIVVDTTKAGDIYKFYNFDENAVKRSIVE